MTSYVLDACAMVALINKEEGAEIVDNFFQQAAKGEIKLYISIINLLEVYYGFIGDIGVIKTQEIMTVIDETPLTVINIISYFASKHIELCALEEKIVHGFSLI